MKILMQIINLMLQFKKSEHNVDLTHVSGWIFGRYPKKDLSESDKETTYFKVRELIRYHESLDGEVRRYSSALTCLEVVLLGYMYELKIEGSRQFNTKCEKLQELNSKGATEVELIAELFRDCGTYRVIESMTERYLHSKGWTMSDNAFRLRDVLNDKAIRGKYTIPDDLKTKQITGIVNKYDPKLSKSEVTEMTRNEMSDILGGTGYLYWNSPANDGLGYDKEFVDKVLELI